MLQARGLTMRFEDGRYAVKDLNLTVNRGEIFGLLGPNGAGKTTTINLFLDFIRPTKGKCLVDKVVVEEAPREAKRRLALIPENVALYPTLTAIQNVEFFGGLGATAPPSRERCREALSRVKLAEEVFDTRVGCFSKGMRQRVGIAVILVQGPAAVLLDEPTSGLDPKAAREFGDLLGILKETMAVLMTTHDLFRAATTCDRVGIMRDGCLCEVVERSHKSWEDLESCYLRAMA